MSDQVGTTSSSRSSSSQPRVGTRRALLAGAMGGIAAAAAGAFGRVSPARADGENIQVGGEYGTAQSVTWLQNGTNTNEVFRAESTAGGTALHGKSNAFIGVLGEGPSAYGVYGTSTSGYGVYGNSSTNNGVFGNSSAGFGVHGSGAGGVRGIGTSGIGIYGSSSTNNGVRGLSTDGDGVYAFSTNGGGVFGQSNHGIGVRGLSASVQGVRGEGAIGVEGVSDNKYAWGVGGHNNNATKGIGVWGEANAAGGIGVAGHSANGRGGRFSGKKAQLRLSPSSRATHPGTGAKGDVFVDASARLWFCRGGSTWVRLA